jgi:hypothetical protein
VTWSSAVRSNQITLTATVIMVLAGAAVGYLGNIATRAQEQLAAGGRGGRRATPSGSGWRAACTTPCCRSSPWCSGGVRRSAARRPNWVDSPGRRRPRCGRWSARPAAVPAPRGMADLREAVSTLASDRVNSPPGDRGVGCRRDRAKEVGRRVRGDRQRAPHCPADTRRGSCWRTSPAR